MKNYPEPEGRAWDVAERLLLWALAALLCAGVYFAFYFANVIQECSDVHAHL